MENYKREFIEFMVRSGVLTFGDFTTKSGRRTPYFVNTGSYRRGAQMARLGRFYARALVERLGRDFDNLYGPAYKGIPLCVAASIALAESEGHDVSFTFNRKEAKDHGEGGSLIGHRYAGGERVVLIEDVITAGTSLRESLELLRREAPDDVRVRALVVSVDRMERGSGPRSALAEAREEHGIEAFAIVTLDEVVAHLSEHEVDGRRLLDAELLERIAAYRAEYGADA